MTTKFSVFVKPDPHAEGTVMIVIADELDRGIRIPARGLTPAKANELVDPIKFAFEAGFASAFEAILRVNDIEVDGVKS